MWSEGGKADPADTATSSTRGRAESRSEPSPGKERPQPRAPEPEPPAPDPVRTSRPSLKALFSGKRDEPEETRPEPASSRDSSVRRTGEQDRPQAGISTRSGRSGGDMDEAPLPPPRGTVGKGSGKASAGDMDELPPARGKGDREERGGHLRLATGTERRPEEKARPARDTGRSLSSGDMDEPPFFETDSKSWSSTSSSEDTTEMKAPPGGGGLSALRSRIEAAIVGRDAVRHQEREEARRAGQQNQRDALEEAPRKSSSSSPDRPRPAARTPESEERDRGRMAAERGRAAIPPVRDNSRPASSKPETPRPGEQFHAELYYTGARTRALPGEPEEEFFSKGALKPRHYALIIAALAAILLALVLAIVWVWSENLTFVLIGVALILVFIVGGWALSRFL